MNSRGEANIYTGVALKLIFTIPSGDPTSPIWSVDYIGEMQANYVTGAGVTPSTNNYVVTTMPAVAALSDMLQLTMTPDEDNSDTINPAAATIFTGSGSNDLTPSGPYLGSTSSTFTITIDGAYHEPPVAPTAAENVTVGLVTIGNHYVKLTAVTALGESIPGAASGVVAAAGGRQIDVTVIPALAGQVTGYKVYMTKAGGTAYYYVATVTATTYTINVADASLTVLAPTVDSTGTADTFSWIKDGLTLHSGVPIDPAGATQVLQEGFSVTFATVSGHTYGNIWAVPVIPAARVKLDSTANLVVYKNKGGAIVPLDGHDLVKDSPAQMIYSPGLGGYILTNPMTPVFSTTTISAVRYRKTITADYVLLDTDQGKELSFTGDVTVTLLTPPQFANHFVYFANHGTGMITIDAGADYLIYGTLPGSRYYYLNPNSTVQLQTNSVDWHVMTSLGYPMLAAQNTITVGAASSEFAGLIPGLKYRIEYELTLTAATTLFLRFNDDAVNYVGAVVYMDDSGVTGGDGITNTEIPFTQVVALPATFSWGSVDFATVVGDPTYVKIRGESNYDQATLNHGIIYGRYNGGSNLSWATIHTDGTFVGTILLYQVG